LLDEGGTGYYSLKALYEHVLRWNQQYWSFVELFSVEEIGSKCPIVSQEPQNPKLNYLCNLTTNLQMIIEFERKMFELYTANI
jgi:hypothetical protein